VTNFMFTDPLAPPPTQAPSVGELVPLGHAVIKVNVSAATTMPDTPPGYSADLQVMADQGDLDTSQLAGDQGPPGQIRFQVTQVIDPTIRTPHDLKPLTNTPRDIGRYYVFQEFNNQGMVVAQWAYIWYGTSYRKLMMGSYGPPGPVPRITPEVELIDPDLPSYVRTFGPRLAPDWLFELAAPPGPNGPSQLLYLFGDVDEDPATVEAGDLMTFTTSDVWRPQGIGGLLPHPYSVPQSAFWAYTGFSQQHTVGQFTVAAQPHPWSPIVWGHIGEGGIMLSQNPFKVGCQVLLGDPVKGTMIARGFGTTLGECNIYPHYSTKANTTQALTPTNGYAVVPPGQRARPRRRRRPPRAAPSPSSKPATTTPPPSGPPSPKATPSSCWSAGSPTPGW
jgi:hypothetical protein